MDRGPIIPEGTEATYDRFHFAPAFRAGNTVYVSGVIGSGETPAEEFADAFAQLDAVLQAAGSSLDNIVDMTTFHTDMSLFAEFMAAKDAVLSEPWPAWTAIGCTELAIPGALVEVKVTAVDQQ